MAAATTPAIGYGTTVTWRGHDVGFITAIGGIGGKTDMVEITNNDSADAHKEFVPAFVDGGELSITCRHIGGDTTGQMTMRTDWQGRTSGQLVITRPDAITKTKFMGYISSYDDPVPVGDSMDVTFSIKITGKPEFTNS